MHKPSSSVGKFRLKPMVFARIFSEIAVLVVLILLPLLLHSMGKFGGLPVPVKAVLVAVAGIAACIVPWFGYVTYQVTADDIGITALSVFVKQSARWEQVKNLSRRSSLNFLRYVVAVEDQKELTFPVLLHECDQLVAIIRGHLPAGSGVARRDPFRTFRNDPLALIVQLVQSLGGILFIIISWLFCLSVVKQSSRADAATIVVFCSILTAALLWRTAVVLLMPKMLRLEPEELIVATLFFERHYKWQEVRAVKPPFPLLPEGFMLRLKKCSYLIGSGMDAADELQDAIRSKIEATPPA